MQQALDRDRQCIFSGAMPSDCEALVVTWIFPPFMAYQASATRCIYDNIDAILISCRMTHGWSLSTIKIPTHAI
jgi:hypothetical protein